VRVIQRRRIWLVGEAPVELAPAALWLREHARCEPTGIPAATGIPSAIVVLQSRPGEFSQEQIEALHRRAPLARLIVLAGAWCEGELRSGRPAHGVTRILWHQWRERLPRELELATSPRTTSEAESLLRTIPQRTESDCGLVAICTRRRESFAALVEACLVAGLRGVWQQPQAPRVVDGADVLLIDGWESIEGPRLLARGSIPAVLLLDWPRPEDLIRAAGQKIDRVLGQPAQLADLVAAMRDVIGGQPFVARRAAIA
jgi:hypothetical protein